MTKSAALAATKNVSLILIVLDACLIGDKHPALGLCIALLLMAIMFWAGFRHHKLNPEPCCPCDTCGCSCHREEEHA
jgi:hypothetical protein